MRMPISVYRFQLDGNLQPIRYGYEYIEWYGTTQHKVHIHTSGDGHDSWNFARAIVSSFIACIGLCYIYKLQLLQLLHRLCSLREYIMPSYCEADACK